MEWERIMYRGNFFNYIPLSLFSLLYMGVFVFFFIAPIVETKSKTDFEIKLMMVLFITMVISLIILIIGNIIGILLVIGNSKSFIIRKGFWPSQKNKIEIKINDVLEWKETKMPWYTLLKENEQGRMDYKAEVESRYYNAVEIWLRDGRSIAFRCKRPLDFFDYLKEMKSQNH
jgi:hypothetical protein